MRNISLLPATERLAHVICFFAFHIFIALCITDVASVWAQTKPPVLLTRSTSTRAIALESPTSKPEPFTAVSQIAWHSDVNTRIILFATDLNLLPGDNATAISAQAQDASNRIVPLTVEFVGTVPNQPWLSQLVVRLDNQIAGVGDVLLGIQYRGMSSNRVRVGMGFVGSGPPDDPGSAPTPAPAFAFVGHTTGLDGTPLGGITITMKGPENAVVQTAGDGSYGLTTNTPGNYTLTPSNNANFIFTRSIRTLAGPPDSRTVDFVGISTSLGTSNVLEFNGTPETVDCDSFWTTDGPLGHFFWEVWAAPGLHAGATYMISDGYGGAHAILFGFAGYGTTEPDRYQLFGDIWDFVSVKYFGSDEGPGVGEWGHFAVGWDGNYITTYFNGVPSGRSPFIGSRWTPGYGGGGGRLLIGGSDHNNLDGRMAQVRGYEDKNPREDTSVYAAFAPDAVFSRGGNYLGRFFEQAQIVPDLSNGYRALLHPGVLRGTLGGVLADCPGCPVPQYVVDPTAPDFLRSPVNNSAHIDLPSTPPAQALVFDSFSRANATYALGSGGLKTTEAGSAGPLVWKSSSAASGPNSFGVLNGRVVVLANEMAVAWVQPPQQSSNLRIQTTRHPGTWGSGLDTGIAFRVTDAKNFFFAYSHGDDKFPPGDRKLHVGYFRNGVRTDLINNVVMPSSWLQLIVETNSNGQFTISTDTAAVYTGSSSAMANSKGAGIYNDGPGLGLVNRWDDFTIFRLP